MSDMGKTRRKFSREFKAEIVELVLHGQQTVPDVSKKHELNESSVYAWVRQAKVDGGLGRAGSLTTAEKEELSVLRRENRELRRERDFLRNAATYFAQAKK